MPIDLTSAAAGLRSGVEITEDDPETEAGGGIDVGFGGADARVKNVSKNRTDYDIKSPRNLPVRVGGGFSEDRQTREVNGGHIGGGVGTKGVGLDIDIGYHNCQVEVNLSGGVSIPGVQKSNISFSIPNPVCGEKPDPPEPPAPPDRDNYDIPVPLPDDHCEEGETLLLLVYYESQIDRSDAQVSTGVEWRTDESIVTISPAKIEYPYEGDHLVRKSRYSSFGDRIYYEDVKPDIYIKVDINVKQKVNTSYWNLPRDVNAPLPLGYSPKKYPLPLSIYNYLEYRNGHKDYPKTWEYYICIEDMLSYAGMYIYDFRYTPNLHWGSLYLAQHPYLKIAEARGQLGLRETQELKILHNRGTTIPGEKPFNVPSLIAPRTINFVDGWSIPAQTYELVYKFVRGLPILLCPGENYDRDDRNRKKRRRDLNCCSSSTRITRELREKVKDQQDDIDELKRMVKEMHQVINPREFLDGKMSIPKRFIYPGGQGQENIPDYPHAYTNLIRFLDKVFGIPDPEIKIADANPEKGMNQPLSIKPSSIGDTLRMLLEHTIESEVNTQTDLNLGARLAFICMQILKTVTSTWHLCENMEHYADYHVKHTKTKVKMPFNPHITQDEGKIGFGSVKVGQSEVDKFDKASIHDLMNKLLQSGETEIEITEVLDKTLLHEHIMEIKKFCTAAGGSVSHEFQGENRLRDFFNSVLLVKNLGDFAQKQNFMEVLEVGDLGVFLRDLATHNSASADAKAREDKSIPKREPAIRKVSKSQNRKKRNRRIT